MVLYPAVFNTVYQLQGQLVRIANVIYAPGGDSAFRHGRVSAGGRGLYPHRHIGVGQGSQRFGAVIAHATEQNVSGFVAVTAADIEYDLVNGWAIGAGPVGAQGLR